MDAAKNQLDAAREALVELAECFTTDGQRQRKFAGVDSSGSLGRIILPVAFALLRENRLLLDRETYYVTIHGIQRVSGVRQRKPRLREFLQRGFHGRVERTV